VQRALARRGDVAAARLRRQAAELMERVAARERAPRLDVVVGGGYTGMDQAPGLRRYVAPVYQGIAGLNSTVQLTYLPALGPTAARMAAEQAEVSTTLATIAADNAERAAASGAYTALVALRSAGAELTTAEEAVQISTHALESETAKFRLGMATRLEVMQAEDGMTAALLGRIGAQARRAEAVVRLRLALAELVPAELAPAGLGTGRDR
jgi:outer membrane protein TolC